MTPRLNLILLAIALILGIPFYWYFLDAHTQGARPEALTIATLRDLARQDTGPHPVAIRQEIVGFDTVPGNLLAAGTGLLPVPFVVRAYRITMADGTTITIDAGTSQLAAKALGIKKFNPIAQHKVDVAVRQARIALHLYRQPLHDGGIGFADGPGDTAPSSGTPSVTSAPHAVAPGVVSIPLPGHASGLRMIYVRLLDGREFLFTGDAAILRASWQDVRPPARYVTSVRRPEDRTQVASWLLTIRALHKAAPSLFVIEGHDARPMPELQTGFVDPVKTASKTVASKTGKRAHNPIRAWARDTGHQVGQGRKRAS